MYTLFFSRIDAPEKILSKQKLGRNTTSIGRDVSCDIQLVEPDISRIHALITRDSSRIYITDKSSNGTFVNDLRIKKQRLTENDRIRVSSWILTVKGEENEEDDVKTIINNKTKGHILGCNTNKKNTAGLTLDLLIKQPNGNTSTAQITQATFGSDPSNDIVICDPYVASKHFSISMIGRGFLLEDLGSANGTCLDDRKTKTAYLAKAGCIVIGATSIIYRTIETTEKIDPSANTSFGPIVGRSQKMRELFSMISQIAPSNVPVCITGESGTGKELIARFLHESGPRKKKAFVAVNCGAIPANLIESEFFGHEKGSFTGAATQHNGYFEQAHGGTIFLDEIGEMPQELQTRLLRALETRTIKRIGGKHEIPFDARIICATNRDLQTMTKDGKFRSDLFFRLYVMPIKLDPLRERPEDIEMLAEHFLSSLLPQNSPKYYTSSALYKLINHTWPGNVRELKNTVQRAILMSKNDKITEDDIIFSTPAEDAVIRQDLCSHKKAAIAEALKRSNGNASAAARSLGIARSTLYSMLKRFKDVSHNVSS